MNRLKKKKLKAQDNYYIIIMNANPWKEEIFLFIFVF